MARVDNLTNFLTDVAGAIKIQRNNMSNITPNLFDTEILNLPVLDTSDATATAPAILNGSTAYVNGNKLTGTMPNNGELNYSPAITVQNIPAGYTSGGVINAVTSSIDLNITPENIKNGINILGVIGNLSPGGGSGEVRLFDTISNMQSSTGNVDGQLAIVYANNLENITSTTEFQIAIFPKTVVLPSAITSYIEVSFIEASGGGMSQAYGSLDATEFSLNGNFYGETQVDFNIQYTSSDGITYTRTIFTRNGEELSDDEMDFGVTIKFGSYWGQATWNNAIGYFIQTGGVEFNGLYQYGSNVYSLAKTQFSVSSMDVYNGVFYGSNGIETGTLQNPECEDITELKNKVLLYNDISNLSLASSVDYYTDVFANNQNLKYVPSFTITNATNFCNFYINCTNLVDIGVFNIPNATFITNMFLNCNNLSNSAYANITNSLPNAYNLTHIRSLQNVGLNFMNFTNDQLNILYNKGYGDAIPIDIENWSNIYNISYE